MSLMRRSLITICLTAICLCACVDTPPPIAKGLPNKFADVPSAFDQRVKERFPLGSAESALVAELRREHFGIRERTEPNSPFHFSAAREVGDFVCKRRYEISWNASSGTIADVGSAFSVTCL